MSMTVYWDKLFSVTRLPFKHSLNGSSIYYKWSHLDILSETSSTLVIQAKNL